MASKKKKQTTTGIYAYQKGSLIALVIITLLLTGIMLYSFFDPGTWLGGFPVITLLLVPIVFFFAWTIWQDGSAKLRVTRDSMVWEKGAWRFKTLVEIPWEDIGAVNDRTRIFTIGRRFDIISASDPKKVIRLNSSMAPYRDLLRLIISRVPIAVFTARAKKSLGFMHLMKQ